MFFFFFLLIPPPPRSTLFPYTTLFRSSPLSSAFLLLAFTDSEKCKSSRAESESRSEEHTSELQSRLHLVCRLLLEKKKLEQRNQYPIITAHSPPGSSTTQNITT